MGEKGNVADVRPVGGHVPAAPSPQNVGLGGQSLAGAQGGGGGGGGLLSDLADEAKDKVSDVGLGVVKRDKDDEET